jgi:small-conductance mechanosensitive channel
MQEFLRTDLLQNTISEYLIAIAIFLGGAIILTFLEKLIVGRLKRWARTTSNTFDDKFIHLLERSLIPLLYLGIFYVSISNLNLHPILARAKDVLILFIATVLGIRLLGSIAEYSIKIYWLARRQYSPTVEQSLNALIPAINVALWALGIVFLLDNLGFDISAVVAGLGIGGVAVALASQGVLQDLFSYFAILFDRPFEIGDFIAVDDFLGTIEHIGIKTTRLKSLSGEQLILGNSDLVSARIRNFKRMQSRRVLFTLSITYDVSVKQLQEIPHLIKQIIENTENTQFDRAHFASYGDFSLNFEVVYYVTVSDFNTYMDAQQQINLELKREFEARGIDFAFPTQVTYLNSNHQDGKHTLGRELTVTAED